MPALRPVTPARRPWPPRERDVPPCRNVGIDANAFLFIANIVMKIAAQQLFFLPFQTGHRRKSRGCVPACMQPKQRRGSEYYHTYSAVHFTLCRSIESPNKRVGRRFFVLEKAGQRLQTMAAYRHYWAARGQCGEHSRGHFARPVFIARGANCRPGRRVVTFGVKRTERWLKTKLHTGACEPCSANTANKAALIPRCAPPFAGSPEIAAKRLFFIIITARAKVKPKISGGRPFFTASFCRPG